MTRTTSSPRYMTVTIVAPPEGYKISQVLATASGDALPSWACEVLSARPIPKPKRKGK